MRVQRGAAVEPVGRRFRIERQRAVEARQRLGVAAELAQHVGAVAIGLGEIDVAGERVVEGFQRVLDLALPVQRLADQIVRARLAAAEATASGGRDRCPAGTGPPGRRSRRCNRARRRSAGRCAAPRCSGPWPAPTWPWRWWNRPCWSSSALVAIGRRSKQGCGAMPSLDLAGLVMPARARRSSNPCACRARSRYWVARLRRKDGQRRGMPFAAGLRRGRGS